MENSSVIIERFKKSLKIKSDKELEKILGLRTNMVSTWKKRNSLDYSLLIEHCGLHKIDLNFVFFDIDASQTNIEDELVTPLVERAVLPEYIKGANDLSGLPTYNFPLMKAKTTRAFQAIGGNMSPLIGENAFIVCEKAMPQEIKEKQVMVFVSREKGFFLNRVEKRNGKKLWLTHDNPFQKKIALQLDLDKVDEIWNVVGVFDPNLQERAQSKLNFPQDGTTNEDIQGILIERNRELLANSLKIAHFKNEIKDILNDVGEKKTSIIKRRLRFLLGKEGAWDYFLKKFVDVHPEFEMKLNKQHPNLSKNDIDFCSLIFLGLSNKEIGILLNTSHQSVITKKYRLRKKMKPFLQKKSLEVYLKAF